MRLYYLTAEKWAKVILEEKRLKLSTFNELNDPFELLGAAMGERDARFFLRKLREHWASSLGILCTSRTWANPVMWAHYGDKHKGVCLGFDVPDHLPKEMKYAPERLRGLLDRSLPMMGMNKETLQMMLETKFKDWEYEQEWRLFSKLEDPDPITGHYYINFSPDLLLREVIIGHRCSWAVGSAAKAIGKTPSLVHVFKARPAFDSYKIVRQKQVITVTVEPKK